MCRTRSDSWRGCLQTSLGAVENIIDTRATSSFHWLEGCAAALDKTTSNRLSHNAKRHHILRLTSDASPAHTTGATRLGLLWVVTPLAPPPVARINQLPPTTIAFGVHFVACRSRVQKSMASNTSNRMAHLEFLRGTPHSRRQMASDASSAHAIGATLHPAGAWMLLHWCAC